MTTIADLLDHATALLAPTGSTSQRRAEARFLLARALHRRESWLLAHGDEAVADEVAARFLAWVARRAAGEPAHYIVGTCPFMGREFLVTPAVLIPRPETELVVEAALASDLPPDARILDVGTGSGCIAITLALELPGRLVVATDRSPAALAVARANARRHAAPLHLLAADLAGPLRSTFELVTANLPYVPSEELPTLPPEVRNHEPRLALDGGGDGLGLILALLEALPRLLAQGGRAIFELGDGQADAVGEAARRLGLVERQRVADAAGVARVLVLGSPG